MRVLAKQAAEIIWCSVEEQWKPDHGGTHCMSSENWVRQKKWLTGGSSQFSGGFHTPLWWEHFLQVDVVTFILLFTFSTKPSYCLYFCLGKYEMLLK